MSEHIHPVVADTTSPRSAAEAWLSRVEKALTTPNRPTGWGTAGLDVYWRVGPKREGNLLRRGKQWGCLAYSRCDIPGEISRDEAIDWLCLSPAERQRVYDLAHLAVCIICGVTAVGRKDQAHWERLCWEKPTGQVRVWDFSGDKKLERIYERIYIQLCPQCIGAIVMGQVSLAS